MNGQVRRGSVGEIGTDRMPVRAQNRRTQAAHDTNGKLGGLSAAVRQITDHFFTDDHAFARIFDMDGQGVVEQMTVLHDHQQGIAQGALVAEQQADLAKVRKLAQFSHAQAKGFTATDPRGFLQQANDA
ncbi:hypothetical protein D3C84_991150 [compost metagenome]